MLGCIEHLTKIAAADDIYSAHGQVELSLISTPFPAKSRQTKTMRKVIGNPTHIADDAAAAGGGTAVVLVVDDEGGRETSKTWD